MVKISEHIRHILWQYINKGRIIHLHKEGFEQVTRIIPFRDFSRFCWFPKYFDTDDNYDLKGKFFGHIEVESKDWISLN